MATLDGLPILSYSGWSHLEMRWSAHDLQCTFVEVRADNSCTTCHVGPHIVCGGLFYASCLGSIKVWFVDTKSGIKSEIYDICLAFGRTGLLSCSALWV